MKTFLLCLIIAVLILVVLCLVVVAIGAARNLWLATRITHQPRRPDAADHISGEPEFVACLYGIDTYRRTTWNRGEYLVIISGTCVGFVGMQHRFILEKYLGNRRAHKIIEYCKAHQALMS